MPRHRLRELEHRTVVLTLLLVTAATVTLAQSGNILASTNTDLTGDWRFDTGAGTTAYDTANSNDGTLNNFDFNASSGWIDGKHGKALQFDGGDDTVQVPYDAAMDITDEITMTAWVKHDVDPDQTGSNDWRGIFSRQSNPYRLLLEESGRFSGSVYIGGVRQKTDAPQEYFTVGDWHHVAYTFVGDTGSAKIYVDGKLAVSETKTTGNIDTTANDLVVSGAGTTWNGAIDDVRLYSRALNQSEIKALFNEGAVQIGKTASTAGLVTDLGFDNWNATHVFDRSGTRNHGSARDAQSGSRPTQLNAGYCKVGRCYEFDGNDYMPLRVNYSAFPKGITVMAWIKTTANNAIIASYDRSELYRFGVGSSGTSNKVTWNTNGGGIDDMSGNITVNDGEWHHVAATVNPTNGNKVIYVDGVLDFNKSAGSAGLSTGTTRYGFLGDGSEAGTYNGSRCCGAWTGKIDQFKVFDRPLSQQEIIEEAGIERDAAILDLRFDESGGSVVHDTSVYGNDGTLTPDEATGPNWTDGVQGGGLQVGPNGKLAGVDNTEMAAVYNGSRRFTINLWLRIDEIHTTTQWNDVIQFGDTIKAGSNGVRLERQSNTNDTLSFYTKHEGGNNQHNLGQVSPYTKGKWHMFTLVMDYGTAANESRVYLDAKQTDTVANPGDTWGMIAGTMEVFSNGDWADFTIDNIQILPYAATESKLRELYNRGSSRFGKKTVNREPQDPGRFGLVLQQNMDNYNGSHVLDGSSHANHGDVIGAVERTAGRCQVGRCLDFDGSNDEVRVRGSQALNFSGEFSASAWAYLDISLGSADMGGDWADFVDGQHGFNIRRRPDSDRTEAFFNFASSGKTWLYYTFPEDGWYHLLQTYNGSHALLYVDGRLQDSSFIGSDTLVYESRDTVIGGPTDNNGRIDTVHIYNRSLSPAEISHLYSQGRDRSGTGSMAGPVGWWRFGQYGRIIGDASGEGNTGTWSSPGAAEEKRYIVNAAHAGDQLTVVSYTARNTVTAGTCSTNLDTGELHTFAASCYSVADAVTGDGPFSAHFRRGGADGPVPRSFAGKEFTYRDCRDPEWFNFVAPFGPASVTITNSTSTMASVTVPDGGHTEVNTDTNDGSVYVISSNETILATYDRNTGDQFMLHPMSNDMWGLLETAAVGKDNVNVTIYDSAGNVETMGRYNTYDSISMSAGSQGGTESHHVVANKSALGTDRCADADNGETDIGIPEDRMGQEFYLPEPVDGNAGMDTAGEYYITLTPVDAATCTVYWPNGTELASKSSTFSDPYPGFITFDTSSDFNLTEAGGRVSCTAPAAMQWEPSDAEGEANLYGVEKRPAGKEGVALQFEGDQPAGMTETRKQQVTVPADPSLEPTTEWSITGWVYKDVYSQTGNGAALLWKGNNDKFSVELRSNGLRVNAGGQWGAVTVNSIPADRWIPVAVTYDNSGGNGDLQVYVNGTLQGSATGVAEPVHGSQDVLIGERGDHHEHTFKGKIDDVRLYPYALTAEQVKTVMNQGGTGIG